MSCATCRRPDGRYAIVSFDGLQLGYKVKNKVAFVRTDVKIHAIAGASLLPCMISNEAVAKALGSLLSAKKEAASKKPAKDITTITAMRGHVIALSVLFGNIVVSGVERSFAGAKPHL